MNGSLIWYAQRISAVFLLSYTVWISLFFTTTQTIGFDTWIIFADSFHFKAATSIASVVVLLHSFIGLWTIGTDYLTGRTLGFLNASLIKYADIIRNFYSFLYILWGSAFTFFALFIIWG